MKKKIQDALVLAYKDKVGLTDKKAYARVAALGETYVANEEDIPAFVEKAEDILKGFQGAEDKGRTLEKANTRIAELEQKLAELDKKDETEEETKEQPDQSANIAEAIAAAIAPLKEAFESYKAQNSAKEAKTVAKDAFFSNKWTTKFKEEAEDAWDRAFELNEAKGGVMTADELSGKATEYFNRLVKRKGTDATKPFEAEDQSGTDYDFSGIVKHLEDSGKLATQESR